MTGRSDYQAVNEVYLKLNSLCVYRKLLNDPVISRLYALLEYISDIDGNQIKCSRFLTLYGDFFCSLAESSRSENLIEYILEKLILDDNPFSIKAGSSMSQDLTTALMSAASDDLNALYTAAAFPACAVKDAFIEKTGIGEPQKVIVRELPEWNCRVEKSNPEELDPVRQIMNTFTAHSDKSKWVHSLLRFYRKNGYGIFAKYKAFIWKHVNGHGMLMPVEDPDPVRLSDLIAYETEREEVIRNTEQFIKGHAANNILLYGDRGTGKSSTVKAVMNEYYTEGLRMVEVPKKHLVDFPEIIKALKGRNHKFILFVDDLAFQDNEENYTALKAVLEGGLEIKPSNVLIYATSNRRHLIKEKFSDRNGLAYGDRDDEIRAADGIQEKLSLSDRFGMTIVFSSPDKNRYLGIVEELVKRRGMVIDSEKLIKEALKWELWYNGRSPRTAQQFVNWLAGSGLL